MLSGLQLGQPVPKSAYLPFPLVPEREKWVKDESQLHVNEPGVDIANGILPNAKIGGLIEYKGRIAAFDLIGVEFISDKEIKIFPITNSGVTHDGQIQTEGVVGLMTVDGKLRVSGASVDFASHRRAPDELRPPKIWTNPPGKVAMRSLCSLDRLDFDLNEEDRQAGIFEGTYRRQYF